MGFSHVSWYDWFWPPMIITIPFLFSSEMLIFFIVVSIYPLHYLFNKRWSLDLVNEPHQHQFIKFWFTTYFNTFSFSKQRFHFTDTTSVEFTLCGFYYSVIQIKNYSVYQTTKNEFVHNFFFNTFTLSRR